MADDVPSPKTQADHLEALAKVDAALKRRGKRIVGTVDPTLVDADYAAPSREQTKTVRKIPFTKYEQELHKYLDTLGSQVASQSYNLKGRPVVALGFEVDPTNPSTYNGLYRPKMRGIPNAILKRLAIQAELPAACALTRSTQVSAFGQPRMNRFDKGFVFEPKVGVTDKLDAEEKAKLDQRIESAVARMERCGVTDEIEDSMPPVQRRRVRSFAQFLHETARDAVVVGQIAVERVWSDHLEEADRKLMCFFPRDAGTMYRSCSTLEKGASYREQGLRLIEKLNKLQTGTVIDTQKWVKDEYAYWQVIEGQHRMVFTDKEMVVLNFYPVSDVEMDGYPVTPMDIAVNAITTHLHIGTHNRLYFQSGRAARGMVVITSDEVSEDVVANIRQQLKAVVNGSQNAWTTPVFGLSKDDSITWQAMDSQGGRDMEFQYLADANTRSILTAFQMGPEELTAYGYLSRGTNSQALSESSTEWKLEAARDQGIRPLLSKLEVFVNREILPYLDPGLEKLVSFRFKGLDAETAEKESVRLQQDAPLHMTMDEILQQVEKKPVGKDLGGEVLLNPSWLAIVKSYRTKGYILEHLFGVEGASKDANLAYIEDPMWFQWQQQQAEMKLQAQQAQAGGGAAGQPGQEPSTGDSNEPGGNAAPAPGTDDPARAPAQTERQRTEAAQDASAQGKGQDLGKAAGDAATALGKTEGRRRLLVQSDHVVNHAMRNLRTDIAQATKEIVLSVEELLGERSK